jgi:hypothetical protein
LHAHFPSPKEGIATVRRKTRPFFSAWLAEASRLEGAALRCLVDRRVDAASVARLGLSTA